MLYIFWLKPHNQHQPGRRGMVGMHQRGSNIGDDPPNVASTSHFSSENIDFPQVHTSHFHHCISSSHQNRYRLSNVEKDISNSENKFITSFVPTTTSLGANSLSSTIINIAPSIDIYSPFTIETLSPLAAMSGFQIPATLSSSSTPDVSRVLATTSTSSQPLATPHGRCKHVRKFRA